MGEEMKTRDIGADLFYFAPDALQDWIRNNIDAVKDAIEASRYVKETKPAKDARTIAELEAMCAEITQLLQHRPRSFATDIREFVSYVQASRNASTTSDELAQMHEAARTSLIRLKGRATTATPIEAAPAPAKDDVIFTFLAMNPQGAAQETIAAAAALLGHGDVERADLRKPWIREIDRGGSVGKAYALFVPALPEAEANARKDALSDIPGGFAGWKREAPKLWRAWIEADKSLPRTQPSPLLAVAPPSRYLEWRRGEDDHHWRLDLDAGAHFELRYAPKQKKSYRGPSDMYSVGHFTKSRPPDWIGPGGSEGGSTKVWHPTLGSALAAVRVVMEKYGWNVAPTIPADAADWHKAGRAFVDEERYKLYRVSKKEKASATFREREAHVDVMHDILKEPRTRETEERFKAMKLHYLDFLESTAPKGKRR